MVAKKKPMRKIYIYISHFKASWKLWDVHRLMIDIDTAVQQGTIAESVSHMLSLVEYLLPSNQ